VDALYALVLLHKRHLIMLPQHLDKQAAPVPPPPPASIVFTHFNLCVHPTPPLLPSTHPTPQAKALRWKLSTRRPDGAGDGFAEKHGDVTAKELKEKEQALVKQVGSGLRGARGRGGGGGGGGGGSEG
jgi:uncharacterized membrane protein YgcG